MDFPLLFSPIEINKMVLKNRIVMPAMLLGYSPEGEVTDRLVDFYVLRAKGGVGLVVAGACSIDENAGVANMLSIKDDRLIPGLTRLTRAIHTEGAKIAAQICHMGASVHSSYIGGRTPVSASAVVTTLTGETPRALELDEIPQLQDRYAQAAVRAREAGFDAVEILGAYLIMQFLSPLSNLREDKYGGPLVARMRFGVEVAQKVRKAVGADFPVFMRIGGNEFMEGGTGRNEAITFASKLEEAGIDLINVTGGRHETPVPQIPMIVPRRAYVYLAQGIKFAVSVPVLASNRINDPHDAEQIVRNGQADLVGMARALLADPELPNKARTGKSGLIFHCIGCNQGCLDNLFRSQPASCLINPRAGVEKIYQPSLTANPKRVLVIGGGPGGMKAALTAAELGHEVTLIEKEDRLGGQLLLNTYIPGRKEMVTAATDLTNNLKAHNVTVLLGQKADRRLVKDNSPDVIVVATGAKPVMPNLPGIDNDNVSQAWDVLRGTTQLGKKVVIVGGNAVGVETAIYLAHHGTLSPEVFHFLGVYGAEPWETLFEMLSNGNKEVTVVEMTKRIGPDIGASTRWILLSELKRLGVTVLKGAEVVGITSAGVEIKKQEAADFISADSIVIAVGSMSENKLTSEFEDLAPVVYAIGDAKAPRTAVEDIREGFHSSLKI